MFARTGPLPRTTLVLLRHGASTANEGKRFGGWDDVPLSDRGVQQAVDAGRCLKNEGFKFDVAYSSVLRRAVSTLWYCLDALDQTWLPISNDWRLNERHYGSLQGTSKSEMAALYGTEKVQGWRRGYRSVPPALQPGDPRDSWGDARYGHLRRQDVPLTESLHLTAQRVGACWRERIHPGLIEGRNTLIAAHGNSIRALIMTLEGIGEEEISAVEVPNGVPLVYAFDASSLPAVQRLR